MKIAEALSELRRMFPDAQHHEARLGSALPNEPGWRCQVAVWTHRETGEPMNHYGRGETFEGAIADLERRDAGQSGERRAHPRALHPVAEAFGELPPGGGV